jgi:hypothetical protein
MKKLKVTILTSVLFLFCKICLAQLGVLKTIEDKLASKSYIACFTNNSGFIAGDTMKFCAIIRHKMKSISDTNEIYVAKLFNLCTQEIIYKKNIVFKNQNYQDFICIPFDTKGGIFVFLIAPIYTKPDRAKCYWYQIVNIFDLNQNYYLSDSVIFDSGIVRLKLNLLNTSKKKIKVEKVEVYKNFGGKGEKLKYYFDQVNQFIEFKLDYNLNKDIFAYYNIDLIVNGDNFNFQRIIPRILNKTGFEPIMITNHEVSHIPKSLKIKFHLAKNLLDSTLNFIFADEDSIFFTKEINVRLDSSVTVELINTRKNYISLYVTNDKDIIHQESFLIPVSQEEFYLVKNEILADHSGSLVISSNLDGSNIDDRVFIAINHESLNVKIHGLSDDRCKILCKLSNIDNLSVLKSDLNPFLIPDFIDVDQPRSSYKILATTKNKKPYKGEIEAFTLKKIIPIKTDSFGKYTNTFDLKNDLPFDTIFYKQLYGFKQIVLHFDEGYSKAWMSFISNLIWQNDWDQKKQYLKPNLMVQLPLKEVKITDQSNFKVYELYRPHTIHPFAYNDVDYVCGNGVLNCPFHVPTTLTLYEPFTYPVYGKKYKFYHIAPGPGSSGLMGEITYETLKSTYDENTTLNFFYPEINISDGLFLKGDKSIECDSISFKTNLLWYSTGFNQKQNRINYRFCKSSIKGTYEVRVFIFDKRNNSALKKFTFSNID